MSDDDLDVKVNITLHGDDKVVLQTTAYGLSGPDLLIEVRLPDDDSVHISMEAFGYGTDREGLDKVKELLTMLAETIENEAEQAFVQVEQGSADD